MRCLATTLRGARPAFLAAGLAGCLGGARIEARPQVITFAPAPVPAVNQATATVTATASSGLPVRYTSKTPAACAVDAVSGLVTALASGACTVAAGQQGDATFAAAQQVTQELTFRFSGVVVFGPAPALAVHDLATVTATESTGHAVGYSSTTPATCAVDAATGLVAALAEGDCTVVAAAAGAEGALTFPVAPAGPAAPPSAPGGVTASAGILPGTVEVRAGALQAGGGAVAGWTISSEPPGLGATGPALPLAVTCPASCAGYRFALSATNGSGPGPASAPASVVTRYRVMVTFREPDTQPNDSIFLGGYAYDSSAGVVSGLAGELSESMTGGPNPYPDDTMTWVPVTNQRFATPVTLDGEAGWLVTAFSLEFTDTLTADPKFNGTDGWSPGTGDGLYSGFPGDNPGNAYVMIFVNAAEPTAAPRPAQLARLAYADCAPGGMMGATCMTGTSLEGYGVIGTMGGYPVSQVTTRW